MRIIFNLIIISACVYGGWFLKGRMSPSMSGNNKMAMGQSVPSVFVQEVKAENTTPQSEYIGIVEPIKYADLKPEISGYVQRVLFEEGAFVKKGTVLFVIDPDKYKANVSLKKAELHQVQANLFVIENDYVRKLKLYNERHISQSGIEQAEADLIQAKASEKQAMANLELAEIDYENSQIKAPISGIIGKALITEGNYVIAGQTNLARIVQQNPVRVAFSISDKEFLKDKAIGIDNLKLEIKLANGEILPEKLSGFFIDNEVDKDTATIALYGEFKNEDNLLIPGNYVKVIIYETSDDFNILIPMQAINEDKYGSYVFILNSDSTLTQKRVKTGKIIGTEQIITEGIKAGEKVVIEGLQKIKNGQKVKAQEVK